MNNYIDYDFYTKSYGGTSVPQNSFLRYSIKASAYIDKITFGRISKMYITDSTDEGYNVPDEVKFAVCAVIDVDKKIEDDGGIISSESNGNYSVTYTDGNAGVNTQTISQKEYEAATLFLNGTGLLYKGFIKGVDTDEN